MKEQKTEISLQPCEKLINGRKYLIAADTFTGLVRSRNEDNYAYAWDPSGKYLLAVVADGIGGTRNGDLASDSVVQILVHLWQNWAVPSRNPRHAVKKFLYDTICRINAELFRINAVTAGEYERDSLGTTVTAAVFAPGWAIAANAGDSPMFQIRGQNVRQITFDHNLTNEMIRLGEMRPAEAAALAQGRMLTRFIGPKDSVEPECYSVLIRPGDYYVLCSDGLILHVHPSEMRRIVNTEKDLASALKLMFRKTYLAGAYDNATAILVKAL